MARPGGASWLVRALWVTPELGRQLGPGSESHSPEPTPLTPGASALCPMQEGVTHAGSPRFQDGS